MGDMPRKSKVDRAVDERLHHHEDVGRSGATDRGRHCDEALVVDPELVAECTEKRAGLLPLRLGRFGCCVPDVNAYAYLGGRIGHDSDKSPVDQSMTKA